MFCKGDAVRTPLGVGRVAYQRTAAPDYTKPEAVSVVLDSRRNDPGYTGTIFKASVVKSVEVAQRGEVGST